jgi:hypothetical protein
VSGGAIYAARHQQLGWGDDVGGLCASRASLKIIEKMKNAQILFRRGRLYLDYQLGSKYRKVQSKNRQWNLDNNGEFVSRLGTWSLSRQVGQFFLVSSAPKTSEP